MATEHGDAITARGRRHGGTLPGIGTAELSPDKEAQRLPGSLLLAALARRHAPISSLTFNLLVAAVSGANATITSTSCLCSLSFHHRSAARVAARAEPRGD